MKRILLFLATNLAVVLVLSVVLNIVYAVTGMQPGSLSGLLVMAAVFGFGGAFISLLMSKVWPYAQWVVSSLILHAMRWNIGYWKRYVAKQTKRVSVCQRWRFMMRQT